MSDKSKDILTRALHTAWQAALAYVLLNIDPLIDAISKGEWSGLTTIAYALLLGALGAAFSALKTLKTSKES